jgi:hypothetical protein
MIGHTLYPHTPSISTLSVTLLQVTFEYTRTIDPAAVGQGAGQGAAAAVARTNTYATVEVVSKGPPENLAMVLVGEGLVEVVKHRADDARSGYYDEMCEAEERAETERLGRFSGIGWFGGRMEVL